MPIDLAAFILGLILSALIAAAVLARGELRGHFGLFFAALLLGALLGASGFVFDTEGLMRRLSAPSLGVELLIEGGVVALLDTLLPLLGLSLLFGLPLRRRRRADLFASGAGLGLGYGVLSALVPLGAAGAVWPPVAVLELLSAPSFRLLLTLILAGSMLRTLRLRAVLVLRLAVFALALGHDTGLGAAATLGHWLYWLDPFYLSLAWFGQSVLFWPAIVLLLWLLRSADFDRAPPRRRLALRPNLWLGVAAVLLVACLGAWLTVMLHPDAGALPRLLLVAVLAPPLAAGIVALATGMHLRQRGEAMRAGGARP